MYIEHDITCNKFVIIIIMMLVVVAGSYQLLKIYQLNHIAG